MIPDLRSVSQEPPLPANTEVEQALLGAILINNAAYSRVAEFLAPDHFGNAVHGRIYAAIGKLLDRGQIANPITLKNLFDQDGALIEIGGAKYLAQLAASAVTIINAEHYGRTIHDLHLRRELIAVGQDVVTDAYRHDLDDPAIEQIERATRRFLAIHGRAAPTLSFVGTLSVAAWLDRQIPEPYFLMGEIFSTTSRAMIVADTGIGKTNLALALAFAMAEGSGFLHWRGCGRPVRVLYIDGEMSKRLVRARIADATRRAGTTPATLHILCRDAIEDMPPLNTPEGQRFIDRVIKGLGGADFVFFDNVQALLVGDMKDEGILAANAAVDQRTDRPKHRAIVGSSHRPRREPLLRDQNEGMAARCCDARRGGRVPDSGYRIHPEVHQSKRARAE